jgi:hypothetical protein
VNSKELRIYTALTHPTSPEDYRITDDGKKLYTIMDGGLVCLDGENLDKMKPIDLYDWARRKMNGLRLALW